MSTYRVHLEAGDHAWTVTDDDPPGYGLADPLIVGWSVPDAANRPAQPDPMVLQFSVIRPAADLDLGINDLVIADIRFGSDPSLDGVPDVGFIGRVAQADAQPVAAGMMYKFTCADLTTDLAGYDVGGDLLDPQLVSTRFTALYGAAGLVAGDWLLDPLWTGAEPRRIDRLQLSAEPLLDQLIALFDQVCVDPPDWDQEGPGNQVLSRFILAPAPGPSSVGIDWRWALDAVPDAYVSTASAVLPGTFGPEPTAPGFYGVLFDPDDRDAGVIDACVIDFDSTWSAILTDAIDRTVVTGLWSDLVTDKERHVAVDGRRSRPTPAGQPPTTTRRETQMVSISNDPVVLQQNTARNGSNLAELLLPDTTQTSGWSPESFTWHLWADQPGLEAFPRLFPAHAATGQATPRTARTSPYVRPVVIVGMQPGVNPANPDSTRFAGQLAGAQLTIADGRPEIDLTMYPTLPRVVDSGSSTNSWNAATGTWDEQAGTWDDLDPGQLSFRWTDPALAPESGPVTWDQLYPPDTWTDYQLLRGT